MGALGIMMLRRGTMANPIAGSDYIKFADAEVERILMSKGVSSDGVGITKDDAAKVTNIDKWFPQNKKIETFDELRYFTGLTSIGSSTTTTEKDGFAECSNLRSIILPDTIKKLGALAFFRCDNLTAIQIPDNIEEIGAGTFRSVPAALVISLPKLKKVRAFTDYNVSYTFRASGVRRVEDMGAVSETYGEFNAYQTDARFGVFYECPYLEYADIRNLVSIGACMFGRCDALKDIIMEKAEVIGKGAFIRCSAIETLRIPATAKSISDFAISYCDSLKTLIVEASTPPNIVYDSIGNVPMLASIYVPDASVDLYKSTSYWGSRWSDKIKPLSEYQG